VNALPTTETLYAPRAVTPAQLHGPFAVTALALIPLLWLVRRDGAPVELASAGLLFEAAVLAALRVTNERTPQASPARLAGHAMLGIGLAALAMFVGAHSGLAAFLAAVVVLLGLATGASPAAFRHATAAYVSIAAGQAVIVALTLAGLVPDRALDRLVPGTLPPWKVAAIHGALQAFYLAAFLIGVTAIRRYGQVLEAANRATRDAIRREALIAEAFAEHQRALHADDHGVFAGQRLGSFRLGALIGRGGMGEVYDAVDDVGREVAIKVMRGDRLAEPAAAERLRREAAILARLESPYVAAVYGAGGGAPDLPYFAMERLDGEDLGGHVAAAGRLGRDELRTLIEHGTRALEAVHEAGLVHRDVKPANWMRVVVDGGPRWKLVDFGVAYATGDGGTAASAGTPRFAAPELLRGEPVQARADLYGFGLCLYEAACGRAPFPHADRDALVAAVLDEMPVAPGPDLPGGDAFARVLAVAIAKDPDDRFADAAALRAAALDALDGRCPEDLAVHADRLLAVRPWAEPPVDPDEQSTNVRAAETRNVRAPRTRAAPRTHHGPTPTPAPAMAGRVRVATPLPWPELTDPVPVRTWDWAYLAKVTVTAQIILALCVLGGGFLVLMAERPQPLWIALASMGAIVALVGVILLRVRRGIDASPRAPWILIGALSVGPAYFVGITSAYAAVVATILLHAGVVTRASTRPALQAPWVELRILAAVIVAHTAVGVAILAGALPDAGLYPVREPLATQAEAAVTLAAIQLIYIGALAVSYRLDVAYRAAIAAADRAAREAARAQALLDTARSQLGRTLADPGPGLFTGHRVGAYRLGPLVGRGGMGEVYDASHVDTGRRAAVKLLRVDRLGDRHALERFLHEATALARLDDDAVARVYDVGGLDGEIPHIAMEFLDGQDLATILRDRAPMARAELDALIRDVARGLDAAHAAGVVHRDIKPRNLVRVTQGDGARWKVVDFGIAKLLDQSLGTTGRVVVGTPAYMAPEQAAGRTIDRRADVYSLGLVMYRLVVGRPAFVGGDPGTVLEVIRDGVLDPRHSSDVDADLELVLRIALAFDPADRFASAGELAAAYRAARGGWMSPALRARGEELLRREPWRPGPRPGKR